MSRPSTRRSPYPNQSSPSLSLRACTTSEASTTTLLSPKILDSPISPRMDCLADSFSSIYSNPPTPEKVEIFPEETASINEALDRQKSSSETRRQNESLPSSNRSVRDIATEIAPSTVFYSTEYAQDAGWIPDSGFTRLEQGLKRESEDSGVEIKDEESVEDEKYGERLEVDKNNRKRAPSQVSESNKRWKRREKRKCYVEDEDEAGRIRKGQSETYESAFLASIPANLPQRTTRKRLRDMRSSMDASAATRGSSASGLRTPVSNDGHVDSVSLSENYQTEGYASTISSSGSAFSEDAATDDEDYSDDTDFSNSPSRKRARTATKVDGKGLGESRKPSPEYIQGAGQIILRISSRELVLHNIPVNFDADDDALRLAAIESLGRFN